ncbi:hypothetical protein BJX62DRAFT_238495 [Aspergillus germanicus]
MPETMDDRPDNYPILSLPFTSLKSEYDVVVVGSGYGAGVAGSRMARAGKSVAVLEVGWERRPGSFPHTLRQCVREAAISGPRATNGLLGKLPLSGKTKLFQLQAGEGQHAFCAHGASLINSGVFLEATENTFRMSLWPADFRDNPGSMKEYYNRAADMLQPSLYPESYPAPKKLEHLEEAARLLGKARHFSRVPLTTFFSGGQNAAGISMRPNQGSGHEPTGLNDGSKNSVAVTYLADAWNWGAEIFCGCEVRYVEEAAYGRGYIVYFVWHDRGRGAFSEMETQLFWVKANEFCFLGAGAMGTTEILLRSKKHGLPVSPLVGRNMSGNGDILLFGYNGAKEVNGVAGRPRTPGPTITGMIDDRQDSSSDPLSRYVIQDGCIPEPLTPILPVMLALQTFRDDLWSFIGHPYQQTCRTLAVLKSALRGPYAEGGAMQRTATYLVMGHDSNEIALSLRDDQPHLQAGGPGPKYKGACTGTVTCRALSQRTMRVVSGELEFFVHGDDVVDATRLVYRLHLLSVEGRLHKIKGYKAIDSSAAWSVSRMWRATTTVNVRVVTDEEGAIGAGVVRVAPCSFVRQIRSFRQTKELTIATTLPLLMFLLYFAAQISVFFFHPLIPRLTRTDAGTPYAAKRPATCVHTLKASDGIEVSIEVHDPVSLSENTSGPTRCPILFLPGILGVRPEHSIFSLPYQRCNMIEYFTTRGHRCYILSPRWSCDKRVVTECTVFDARLDIAAAVQHISLHESKKPYVIAHCQGSVALSMALLDGAIESNQLLGVTANSVFMNQVFGYWNSVKAYSPVLIRLYEWLDGRYFPIAPSGGKSFFHYTLDGLLNFYPISKRRDRCRSAACHRTSFSSGLLWNHENLNRDTHDNVDQFFAGTPTRLLEHVTRMGTHGGCLDNELRPLITETNLARLKGLPILFVSGADNEVFDSETTLRDYELLRRRFGERMYRRFLVEGYGHLDPIVGKAADEDVYWRLLEHAGWCLEHTKSQEELAP